MNEPERISVRFFVTEQGANALWLILKSNLDSGNAYYFSVISITFVATSMSVDVLAEILKSFTVNRLR